MQPEIVCVDQHRLTSCHRAVTWQSSTVGDAQRARTSHDQAARAVADHERTSRRISAANRHRSKREASDVVLRRRTTTGVAPACRSWTTWRSTTAASTAATASSGASRLSARPSSRQCRNCLRRHTTSSMTARSELVARLSTVRSLESVATSMVSPDLQGLIPSADPRLTSLVGARASPSASPSATDSRSRETVGDDGRRVGVDVGLGVVLRAATEQARSHQRGERPMRAEHAGRPPRRETLTRTYRRATVTTRADGAVDEPDSSGHASRSPGYFGGMVLPHRRLPVEMRPRASAQEAEHSAGPWLPSARRSAHHRSCAAVPRDEWARHSYAFLEMQGDHPVTWNHCQAIRYTVNPKGAPPDWQEIVHARRSTTSRKPAASSSPTAARTVKTSLIGGRYEG